MLIIERSDGSTEVKDTKVCTPKGFMYSEFDKIRSEFINLIDEYLGNIAPDINRYIMSKDRHINSDPQIMSDMYILHNFDFFEVLVRKSKCHCSKDYGKYIKRMNKVCQILKKKCHSKYYSIKKIDRDKCHLNCALYLKISFNLNKICRDIDKGKLRY